MKQIHSKTKSHKNRRGIAILWLILWGSVFLTFFCGVLEIATMWQAQVEIKNSLDAAALAAVQEWGDSGVGLTDIPRDVGVAYVEANPILGVAFMPTTNLGTVTLANPNANASNTGDFVFGAIDTTTDPITFNGNAETSCAGGGFPAVIAQVTVPTQGFCSALFGVSIFNVSSQSIAYYDCGSGRASLVSVDNIIPP
ncbi:MAG: hypothetical protein K0U86_14660 [Planctomycetes bacterium]|nr:hypothetical protein [Planctomycetota bacterium]MCH9726138.1 hypothetical protein [Planctomycetota bacterium]MCH9775644.1 hypothetical protein [Planctomycetota bacterium]MCH9792572.1 hypothetical protein [Planctomycetota bacterium]